MTECINREKAINEFATRSSFYDAEWGNKRFTLDDVEEILQSIPAADVRPVVHAHWVDVRQEGVCSWTAKCSNCCMRNDIPPVESAHYCPSCGAVMDEEAEDG